MAYTGGEAIVEVLKQQGVKAIFCSPGTEWAPVWEALAKLHAQGQKEPAYFNCRHEMLAVTAAIGYALKGRGLPAVLLHTSSGLLHGSMSIRGAYMTQVPMLVCAGESLRFTEGKGSKGQGHQWTHGLSETGGPSRMAAPFSMTSRLTPAANDFSFHFFFTDLGAMSSTLRLGRTSAVAATSPVSSSIANSVFSRSVFGSTSVQMPQP